jgi:hypothetical protein
LDCKGPIGTPIEFEGRNWNPYWIARALLEPLLNLKGAIGTPLAQAVRVLLVAQMWIRAHYHLEAGVGRGSASHAEAGADTADRGLASQHMGMDSVELFEVFQVSWVCHTPSPGRHGARARAELAARQYDGMTN